MAGAKLSIGDRIRQIRRQRGLTQDQVAEAAGIDSKSLSRIECNRFNPAIDTLQNLATALDVEIQEFFSTAPSSPRQLRAFLFEAISTASDQEIVHIAEAVRKVANRRRTTVSSGQTQRKTRHG